VCVCVCVLNPNKGVGGGYGGGGRAGLRKAAATGDLLAPSHTHLHLWGAVQMPRRCAARPHMYHLYRPLNRRLRALLPDPRGEPILHPAVELLPERPARPQPLRALCEGAVWGLDQMDAVAVQVGAHWGGKAQAGRQAGSTGGCAHASMRCVARGHPLPLPH
jgi:hypothetical protein